jgi:hypothetical protein
LYICIYNLLHILTNNISPLIKFSFNTPKPTRGLDALSELSMVSYFAKMKEYADEMVRVTTSKQLDDDDIVSYILTRLDSEGPRRRLEGEGVE